MGTDGVGREAEFALYDVVAGLQEGLVQQLEHLVRAATEDQALRLQLKGRGDGVAKDRRAAVRIHVQQIGGGGIGLARLGADPQDVLVGRQLDRVRHTLCCRLAGHIGVDIHDPGFGNRF